MTNRYLKTVLYVSTALAGYVVTPAFAQQAADAGTESIIVTAQRTQERLQDVPISMTVFNQQQLSNRNVVTAADLSTYTPSLTIQDNFGADNLTFAIRGFVTTGMTSPSVGVFFADVVAPRGQGGEGGGNGAGPGSFWDLQNVQVLKGPQGTLFGRNTTGGSILLVPQKPTDKFEGYVEVSGGNYNMAQVQAVVNAPIDDKVRVRLGINHESRDGYLHNVSPIGPSNFADTDYTSFRGSIVMDITPDIENYTIATFTDSDTNGDYAKVFGYNPAAPGAATASRISNLTAQEAETAGNFWDVANGKPDARQHVRQWQVINTTTWQATDNLTVKNIASYAQFREAQSENIFGEDGAPSLTNPFQGPPGSVNYIVSVDEEPGDNSISQSTATEELQLQGHTTDKRFTYQVGGYTEQSIPIGLQRQISSTLINCTSTLAFQCTDLVGAAFGIPGFLGTDSINQAKYTFRDYAVYGQGTYKILDQLSLTGGLRYTSDTTSGTGDGLQRHFPAANTPAFTCKLPPPLTVGGTSAQIEANPNLCRYTAHQTSHAPTWLIDLEYKPIDDVMLYGKYSRGYRQGDVNVNFAGLGSWAPEKVDTFEIGAKTQFDSVVRGTFNIAGFYNNFTNQQLPITETSCSPAQLGTPQCPYIGPAAAGIGNAGKSKIAGAELDTSIYPVKDVRLDFAYTYLYTKLELVTLPAIPLGYQALSFPSVVGGPLAFAPKSKLSLTGTYMLPLDESIGKVSVAATFTYQSSEFNNQTAPPGFQTLGSQKNLNLNLNWNNVMGKPFDFSLFATNVTDEKFYEASSGLFNSFGYDAAYLDPPRMFGARLRYHFGS